MSKCDELKRKYSDVTGPYYGYNEVNEAIAELEQKLHDAEMAKDDAEAANTEYREDIRKLKDENVRLKAENGGLKDENARLMSRPCYVCKDEQVKALEKKFKELEGGTLILLNRKRR